MVLPRIVYASIVPLKVFKEYLIETTLKMPFLVWIKTEQFDTWMMDRLFCVTTCTSYKH